MNASARIHSSQVAIVAERQSFLSLVPALTEVHEFGPCPACNDTGILDYTHGDDGWSDACYVCEGLICLKCEDESCDDCQELQRINGEWLLAGFEEESSIDPCPCTGNSCDCKTISHPYQPDDEPN